MSINLLLCLNSITSDDIKGLVTCEVLFSLITTSFHFLVTYGCAKPINKDFERHVLPSKEIVT